MAASGIILCCFLQLIQIIATGSVCIQNYRSGLTLTNTSVFRSQHHNSLSSCLKSCVTTASCEAFSFNLRDLICLYGGTGSEFESTTDLDYITSPSQWQPVIDEIFVHPCTHSTCPEGSECHVKTSGLTVCIKTECADSSSLANSTSLSQERTIGIAVGIVCDDGFVQDGNPLRRCQGNGQWTDNPVCLECTDITHYTTYNRALDHCESTGRQMLQLDNRFTLLPQLMNFTKARCVTCPSDLVADQQIRYLDDDCLPQASKYTNFSSCTCYFTTAVPGKKIRIQSVSLDLQANADFLWIFDGGNMGSPILGSYTGSSSFTLVTNGNEAFISFITDNAVTGTGFRLSYLMVQSDTTSSTPTSLSKPDEYYYIWMEGYIDVPNKEFIKPNGAVFDLSQWVLTTTHKRLCYDPTFDFVDAFSDTDYCHTYCESP